MTKLDKLKEQYKLAMLEYIKFDKEAKLLYDKFDKADIKAYKAHHKVETIKIKIEALAE